MIKTKLFSVVALSTSVLLLASCGKISSNVSNSSSSELSSSLVESSNTSSNTSTSSTSSLVSSTQLDYSTYTGQWIQKGVSDINKSGGTFITLTVDKIGKASGEITDSTANAGRIDTADFSGTIENASMTTNYTDSWGNSGTVTLQFQNGLIDFNATVKGTQQGMILSPDILHMIRK